MTIVERPDRIAPQARASDPAFNVAVAANAGSGKTSTLVNRVARLLLAGARPQAILCVTYTKTAAAEMQRRLFETLGGWAVQDDAALRAALSRIGATANDLGTARQLFARALETPGGLKIQTLHGFADALLRRFPLEAGLAPGFTVLDDAAVHEVSAQARETLALAALDHPDGEIGQAYAHLAVALDVRAFEDLLASFETRRDRVTDYVEACAERGVGVDDDVWLRCGFAQAPADADALEAAAVTACDWARWRSAAAALRVTGMKSDASLADRLAAVAESASGPFETIWRPFRTDKGGKIEKLGTNALDREVFAWLKAEQDRLHGVCGLARAARQAQDTMHALTLALAHGAFYVEAKATRGALDFGDLIARAVALLTRRADAAWVLYKLDGGVDHLLLDEAQDTSPPQWDILRSLAQEFFVGASTRRAERFPRTTFIVGDQKQSIYSFQGAAPERLRSETQALGRLARDAGAPFAEVALIESWRSTPEILAFVDAVFADRTTRTAVVPAPGDEAVRHVVGPPRANHAGGVDLWAPFQDAPSDEPGAWDAPLDTPAPASARKRLARRIAGEIHATIARGETTYDGEAGWRPLQPGDFLILVRRRDALFEEIIRALKVQGVPVAGADRLKLSEHVVFADVLALLRFALYPWDDLTLAALLRSPFCEVDEAGLYALAHPRGDNRFIWGELSQRGDERPEWRSARKFLGWARNEAMARGPFDFLGRVLGYLDDHGRTMRQRILTRLGPEAQDALDAMLGEALAAEARGLTDLERFTAALERAKVEVKREAQGATPGEVGQVRVMTVHGAKGLEAPVVILPDTTGRAPNIRPGLLPAQGGLLFSARASDDVEAATQGRAAIRARDAEEGLRLLYVALTRARDRLIVCGRLGAKEKAPAAESWYARIAAAFDHSTIAGHARAVAAGDVAVRRFGPDPQIAATLRPPHAASGGLPAWLTRAAPKAAESSKYASPSTYAERERGAAPSPLAAAGGLGRFRRGELIHRLLQLLPDIAPADRAAAAARLLGRERDLSPEHRREMADAALGVLGDRRFAEVFGPGSRAEAAVAGRADDLPEGLAISGRVDRMVVGPDRVLVVDFKTNRPSPDRVETADPAYLAQMALYVAVLRAVFPRHRVEAALVWTDGPKLMPIPESLVASTLAGLRRAG